MTTTVDPHNLELNHSKTMREKYERRKEQMRQANRETYLWLRAHGYCVQCRREKAEEGRSLCTACRLYHNQYRSGYTGRVSRKKK